MRYAALAASFLLVAACGENTPGATAPEPVEPMDVSASDELPDLAAPATGIAFWTHPNVAFNGLMIVTGAEGVVSYNIEDGAEVSRIPGVSAKSAAVSYFGYGPEAEGVLVFHNETADAFEFHRIDNVSRAFSKIEGEAGFRGAVRGFCLGRADGVADPSLFVIAKGVVTIFNLSAPEPNAGLSISEPIMLKAPDNLASCAIESDGVLLAASEKGDVYRLDGGDGFAKPFARAAVTEAGDLAVIGASVAEENASPRGALALLDKATGVVTLFDRADGRTIGATRMAATDTIDAVEAATAMGATGANLGALYRSGAIALGVAGDAPSIRLMPVTGVVNTLDISGGEPEAPRGEAPESADRPGLDLKIDPKALQP